MFDSASRVAQRWAGTEKTSRLLKRHIKILEKYFEGKDLTRGHVPQYDDLPPQIHSALDRVKAGESLWSDVDRWIGDYVSDMRYRRASDKTAKAKNKRVFLDLRGDYLILDFRGDSGMGALDPKKLQDMYRDFFLEVVKIHKGGIFTKGISSIEAYKNQLGFHVQRWYQWFGIAEHYSNMADERSSLGVITYSTAEVLDDLEAELQRAGWRVTRA